VSNGLNEYGGDDDQVLAHGSTEEGS